MSVKLVILKSGEDIVCDIQEMIVEGKCSGYILTNPYRIKIFSKDIEDKNEYGISFFPWIALTKQKNILIPFDWIVTVVDPIEEVNSLYQDKVNGIENNQSNSADEQSNSDQSD
jgi:hypothetical protein